MIDRKEFEKALDEKIEAEGLNGAREGVLATYKMFADWAYEWLVKRPTTFSKSEMKRKAYSCPNEVIIHNLQLRNENDVLRDELRAACRALKELKEIQYKAGSKHNIVDAIIHCREVAKRTLENLETSLEDSK